MDQEIAKLWLNTGSLTTTQSQTGIKSANNMTSTFNFDLRIVLGETLWSKYKYFKMFLNDSGVGTGTLAMGTLFQNGLNLIQASYQGKPAGFQTAIDESNLGTTITLPRHLNRSSNTRTFVMIKPDDNNVQLTLEYVDEAGTTTTMTQRVFFLAFVPIDDTKIYRSPYTMVYQNEQANFTLSGTILPSGFSAASNQFGSRDANFTVFTFTNINMRNILGSLWNKYEKFNLICNSIGMVSTGATFSGIQRRMWYEIEGLQFINNLQVTTGYKQGNGFLQQFFYNTTFYSDAEYGEPPMSINTFRKPESENVSLTFYCWTANGGGTIQTLQLNPQNFTFSVVGVKE
jgi:hypothetical protein